MGIHEKHLGEVLLTSDEYQQHMFSWRNKKNSNTFFFLFFFFYKKCVLTDLCLLYLDLGTDLDPATDGS